MKPLCLAAKYFSRAVKWLMAGACALAAAGGQAEVLPVVVNTGGALAVTCSGDGSSAEGNLWFGTVLIAQGNAAGSVMVAPESSGSSVANGAGISVSGTSRPALCTVTDVGASGAVLTLSGGAGNSGVFDPATGILSGVQLTKTGGTETLALELKLSTPSVPATGASGVGTPIYIGGTLTIPASTDLKGEFSAEFTLIVTE